VGLRVSDSASTIACAGCGRQYRWKPALAGKKVRCKCGDTLFVPDEAPGEDFSPLDHALAAAETPAASRKCPLCNSKVSPDAVICIN